MACVAIPALVLFNEKAWQVGVENGNVEAPDQKPRLYQAPFLERQGMR